MTPHGCVGASSVLPVNHFLIIAGYCFHVDEYSKKELKLFSNPLSSAALNRAMALHREGNSAAAEKLLDAAMRAELRARSNPHPMSPMPITRVEKLEAQQPGFAEARNF